jgi:hypothetical protein
METFFVDLFGTKKVSRSLTGFVRESDRTKTKFDWDDLKIFFLYLTVWDEIIENFLFI